MIANSYFDEHKELIGYIQRTLALFKVPTHNVVIVMDAAAWGPFRIEKDAKQDLNEFYTFRLNTNMLSKYANYLRIYLSYPDLFPSIGSANKHLTVSSPHLNDNSLLNDELFEQEPFEFDNERHALFEFLKVLIEKILVVHECFHIINGHVDYISKIKKEHFQQYNNYKIEIPKLDSQTLEMDADACTVCHIFHELQRIKVLHPTTQPVSSDYYFVYSILLVYFIIFSCEAARTDISDYDKITHPIASARMLMIAQTLSEYGQKENVDKALKELLPAFSGIFIKAFEKVLGNFFLGFQEYIVYHNGKIIRNWDGLRPFLLQYAFAELPK